MKRHCRRLRAVMDSTEDWSRLLPELIELILGRLTCLSDHLHFASVCSSWRSVTINNCSSHRHDLPHKLPLLMLPPSNDNTVTRDFFSLSSGKIYEFHVPEIHRKWCCGSSEGWLITVDGSNTGDIQLYNPFSRDRIQLPSLFTFSYPQLNFEPEYARDSHYIHKAIVSENPCIISDYVVVALITNTYKLAYYKPGADRWTTMDTVQWTCFEDVIHYKGLFYAVSNHGHVVTCDFSSALPIVTEITGPEPRSCEMYYLVESLGKLLLVSRHFMWAEDGKLEFKTFKFRVRKLDESKQKWIQMESIGDDRILFLGNSCSMSLTAQDFPECGKGNSIYFNDDYDYGTFDEPNGCPDIGVFNFEDGSVESFCESPSIWTTPTFWITPDSPWVPLIPRFVKRSDT